MKVKSVMGICVIAMLSFSVIGCAPKTFVRSAPGWTTIELNDELRGNYDRAWERTVDTIAREYDIEMLDKDSGYLRTAWLYGISGGKYNSYRGRLTVKYPSVSNPNQVDIRTDAQWLADSGWTAGFDRQFQRDVYMNLGGRLGRVVPTH